MRKSNDGLFASSKRTETKKPDITKEEAIKIRREVMRKIIQVYATKFTKFEDQRIIIKRLYEQKNYLDTIINETEVS